MKRLFKDKRGMTLTEMLVALTLLMIVVVGTTPVMLSSYDGLYQAGEKTQSSYEAKSEIEDTLATRNSTDIVENFKVNFAGLGQVFSVNGKRAVSSLENSLESVFMGGRAYVAIVSSKIINDDKLAHNVILQTTNITFANKNDISYNTPSSVNQNGTGKSIDVSLYLPDKSKTALSDIYGTIAQGDGKGIVVTEANPETGRIYIEVHGVDFTNSPAKIQITYLDETDRTLDGKPKIKKASCYLTIKTPTIMAVGKTTFGDYYTSAGVETFKNPDGTTYNKLFVDARRMPLNEISVTSSTYKFEDATVVIKSGVTKRSDGTIFKSVTWVNNDTTTENVEPYYVITGTNGTIYRTYSFTQEFASIMNTLQVKDQIYVLDDAGSTKVYPALWGGDFSHQFGYSTYGTDMGYAQGDWCWYTEDPNNLGYGNPKAEAYSTTVKYAYYYNGYGMSYGYDTQRSRKISYILTEVGHSFRIGGLMQDLEDYAENFNKIWERYGSGDAGSGTRADGYSWYYRTKNGDLDDVPEPVYYTNASTGSASNYDTGYAQIRLKYLTTNSSSYMQDNERANDDDKASDVRWLNSSVDYSKITVTDAIYIPPSGVANDKATGKMFYIGTVAAYAYINQTDNISGTNNYQKKVRRDKTYHGARTGYLILGNDDSSATSIYKYSYGSMEKHDTYHDLKGNKTQVTSTPITTDSIEAKKFFVHRSSNTTVSKLFSDVLFTMGFSSSREMVYQENVYGFVNGKRTEAYKGCEPFYFKSHYDDENHMANLFLVNGSNYANAVTKAVNDSFFNSVDNDYYNVWFPGEMYNLTKIATKDGVTVAVGYAVAGSAYQYVHSGNDTNTSTALGGIFNDGVLSAMVGGVHSSLKNLLYYKDNVSFDGTSLTSGNLNYNYKNYNGSNYSGVGNDYGLFDTKGYGTHSRYSVQFTCVDISVEYVKSGSNEVGTYYAYYADNRGRLYRSKIATKTTAIENATSEGIPQLVSHIADEANDGSRTAPSYMEEIKIGSQSLGDYFSKITTISCDGDYIIVGGHSKDSNFNLVIGKITYQQDSSGNPISSSVSWKYGVIGGAGVYQLEDAIILDGYIYLAGVSKSDASLTRGFVCALPLEQTGAIANGGNLPYDPNLFVGDENLQDPLYSIAGHK